MRYAVIYDDGWCIYDLYCDEVAMRIKSSERANELAELNVIEPIEQVIPTELILSIYRDTAPRWEPMSDMKLNLIKGYLNDQANLICDDLEPGDQMLLTNFDHTVPYIYQRFVYVAMKYLNFMGCLPQLNIERLINDKDRFYREHLFTWAED